MMCSLFLICVFVILISVSTGRGIFEIDNECGCYWHTCPKPHKARCINRHDNYEGLFLQNSPSPKSPEVCNKWFLEGFEENMILSENGTLQITLFFSSFLRSEFSVELQLRYEEQCRPDVNSTFYLLEDTHSIEHITAVGTSDLSCKKMIEVTFPYVFSGCYQLYINNTTNPEISGGCMSKPFYVASSYTKAPLSKSNVTSIADYISQRQELIFTSVFGNLSFGLNPNSAVITLRSHIDLSLDDCAGSGNEAAKYLLPAKGGCCNAIDHESDPSRNMTCPCTWDNDITLVCKYNKLPKGNYCLIIRFIDPRCQESTLWTEKDQGCFWFARQTVEGEVQPTEVLVNNHDGSGVYVLILSLCFVAMALMISFLLFLLKFVEKKRRYILGNTAIMEKSCFINEECEILLLYPRDCEEFMMAMEQFRILLRESYSCRVHDPWEEEMFDKVAESLETWTWPLIENSNIKIIVILSECSKLMEEAFIDDKHSVVYRDPRVFDSIFGSSLKHVNLYFATRSDSYQRVFVVRLDEAPVLNWSFHFNCATVYILPHSLDSLIKDLFNGCSITIHEENIEKLKAALRNYHLFKQRNPNYLNEILEVNNNHKA